MLVDKSPPQRPENLGAGSDGALDCSRAKSAMLSFCHKLGNRAALTIALTLLMYVGASGTSAQELKTTGSSLGFSEAPLVYSAGGRTFEGVVVRPNASDGLRRPAVIIAPDFRDEGQNTLDVARKLAALGYVAVGADFYGQGIRPHDTNGALAMAKSVRARVPELRMVMRAAYDATAKLPGVDDRRIAVVGYSVGGVAALELALDRFGGLSFMIDNQTSNINDRVFCGKG